MKVCPHRDAPVRVDTLNDEPQVVVEVDRTLNVFDVNEGL
jgi:hypothetical protein